VTTQTAAEVRSPFDLHGRCAVVTGAGRGLGRAVALGLAQAGADLVLLGRPGSQDGTRDQVSDLGRDVERPREVERSLRPELVEEGAPAEVLHRDVEVPVGELPVEEDPDDVRVIELDGDPRLAVEPADGVGEIVVTGPNVSARYHWPEAANLLGKIVDGERVWHRTGDIGWIDDEGRIWFCGRKSQRIVTGERTLHTVQVEQIFNTVAGVARTALVGVGARTQQRPVVCVEVESGA
jgi:acyl-CoA synthetase (AMP-forming)/AMP-acid ligase II